MTPKAKIRYFDSHIKKIEKRYKNHIDSKKDSTLSQEQYYAGWKKIRMREIKKSLDTIELGTVLMPDSFRVVSSSSVTNGSNGWRGTQTLDIKHIIITNKNKIKYIKKHHIVDSNLVLIER